MLTLNVQSDLLRAMTQLRSITEAEQFRFAAARALTKTAVEVQAEVRRNMPSRFTLRRQWVVKGIVVDKATKQDLTATVRSRDKFMGLQEVGGPKSPLRQYLAVPTRLVRRTKTDMIAKSDRPKNLGDKAAVVEYNGRKWLALKKGRGVNKLRLLYLLVPRANITERLGLRKDGMTVARGRFLANLADTLAAAVRSAR